MCPWVRFLLERYYASILKIKSLYRLFDILQPFGQAFGQTFASAICLMPHATVQLIFVL